MIYRRKTLDADIQTYIQTYIQKYIHTDTSAYTVALKFYWTRLNVCAWICEHLCIRMDQNFWSTLCATGPLRFIVLTFFIFTRLSSCVSLPWPHPVPARAGPTGKRDDAPRGSTHALNCFLFGRRGFRLSSPVHCVHWTLAFGSQENATKENTQPKNWKLLFSMPSQPAPLPRIFMNLLWIINLTFFALLKPG